MASVPFIYFIGKLCTSFNHYAYISVDSNLSIKILMYIQLSLSFNWGADRVEVGAVTTTAGLFSRSAQCPWPWVTERS